MDLRVRKKILSYSQEICLELINCSRSWLENARSATHSNHLKVITVLPVDDVLLAWIITVHG